jgi:hypothetical protein
VCSGVDVEKNFSSDEDPSEALQAGRIDRAMSVVMRCGTLVMLSVYQANDATYWGDADASCLQAIS